MITIIYNTIRWTRLQLNIHFVSFSRIPEPLRFTRQFLLPFLTWQLFFPRKSCFASFSVTAVFFYWYPVQFCLSLPFISARIRFAFMVFACWWLCLRVSTTRTKFPFFFFFPAQYAQLCLLMCYDDLVLASSDQIISSWLASRKDILGLNSSWVYGCSGDTNLFVLCHRRLCKKRLHYANHWSLIYLWFDVRCVGGSVESLSPCFAHGLGIFNPTMLLLDPLSWLFTQILRILLLIPVKTIMTKEANTL